MARNRSLLDLREDTRIAADVQGKILRHPNSEVTRHLNEAIQAFRILVSESGHTYYLQGTPCQFPAGQTLVTIPVPPIDTPYAIFGVDVFVNGIEQELAPLQFQDRNRYGGLAAGAVNGIRGVPRYYFAPNSTTAGLVFTPRADSTYEGIVFYLPTGGDLVADADLFDGIAGWEDWPVWEAASRICVKDGNTEQVQILLAKKADLEARIRLAAPRRVREVLRRLDTRSRRRQLDRFARYPWW